MPSTRERIFGVSEIQLSGFHGRLRHPDGGLRRELGRLRGGDVGLGALLRLQFAIHLALRDGARRGERRITLHVDLRQFQLGRGLRQLPFGLGLLPVGLRELTPRHVSGCLEGTRVDFEEHVVLVHETAFAIVLANYVTRDIGADFGVEKPFESRHPFARDRHVPLGCGSHADFRGQRRPGRPSTALAASGSNRD